MSQEQRCHVFLLQAASRGGSVVLRTGTRPHTRCCFSSDATWVGESGSDSPGKPLCCEG